MTLFLKSQRDLRPSEDSPSRFESFDLSITGQYCLQNPDLMIIWKALNELSNSLITLDYFVFIGKKSTSQLATMLANPLWQVGFLARAANNEMWLRHC